MTRKIKMALKNLFLKIRNFFTLLPPPSVVHTRHCVHCGIEYPYEYLTQKIVKREGNEGRYAFYYLYLCPACVLINPKFHHAEMTRGSWMRYFWDDEEGNIYEFYEFKKNGNGHEYKFDEIPKDVVLPDEDGEHLDDADEDDEDDEGGENRIS